MDCCARPFPKGDSKRGGLCFHPANMLSDPKTPGSLDFTCKPCKPTGGTQEDSQNGRNLRASWLRDPRFSSRGNGSSAFVFDVHPGLSSRDPTSLKKKERKRKPLLWLSWICEMRAQKSKRGAQTAVPFSRSGKHQEKLT